MRSDRDRRPTARPRATSSARVSRRDTRDNRLRPEGGSPSSAGYVKKTWLETSPNPPPAPARGRRPVIRLHVMQEQALTFITAAPIRISIRISNFFILPTRAGSSKNRRLPRVVGQHHAHGVHCLSGRFATSPRSAAMMAPRIGKETTIGRSLSRRRRGRRERATTGGRSSEPQNRRSANGELPSTAEVP